MTLLEGKVAVITGGARGQGAAEAELFAREGAVVYVTDVREDEGAVTAAKCNGRFVRHDVSRPEDWSRLAELVTSEAGHIDVLVNNAGILSFASLAGTSLALWEKTIAVNQTGTFLGVQTVAPLMASRRSGVIINIASVGGMAASSRTFAYGVTKWAVRGITRSAAQEFGPSGVRVNTIVPGAIDTEMMAGQALDQIALRAPLRRYGTASEVAELALWLASDKSAFVSGAEYVIDGGYLA
jgi:NAD(P)-dependent dehydrogenase (short-subunit alcohol dehydrogenase family)